MICGFIYSERGFRMRQRIGLLFLVLLLAASPALGDFQRGKVLRDIFCKEASQYSYLLYLPENFDPDREAPWPVVFIMAPQGGTPQLMKRFVSGAEQNGWILAMSTQSSEKFEDSDAAVKAMVEDVFSSFPVDEKQCYAAGFRHGGDMAFMLAQEYPKNIAGLLVGNTIIPDKSIKVPAYIFCRAGGGARSRIVYHRSNLRNEHVIKFYVSDQNITAEEHNTEAMQWLQCQYLNHEGGKEAIAHCSSQMMDFILMDLKSDPYAAYGRAELLSQLKKFPNSKEAKKLVSELKKNPEVKHCIDAKKAMDRFIDDYLNLLNHEYEKLYRESNEPEKAAEKFYAEFSDTPYAEIINELGMKTAFQNQPVPF